MLGFIYLQFDRKSKMFYLGSHMGSENDNYAGSGKWFRSAYAKRPEDFKRRVIERIKFDDLPYHGNSKSNPIRIAEQRWLNMIKLEELGVRYYNLNLRASGHTSESSLAALHSIKDEQGRSVNSVKNAALLHSVKNENGKSAIASKVWNRLHSIKDERGKSVLAVKSGKASAKVSVDRLRQLHSIKDEKGRSVFGVKLGRKGAAKLHSIKDENGKSAAGVKGGTRGAATLHALKDERGKSIAQIKTAHNYWHTRRGVVNKDCMFCNDLGINL